MSVPVYCYLEQPGSGSDVFADLKWAIRPLGPPLNNAPPWTNFNMPIAAMIKQITGLNDEMRHEFMISMDSILKAKYLAQTRFDGNAPIYSEEDLRKRAPGVIQRIHSVGFNPCPTPIRRGEDEAASDTTKSKRISGSERQEIRRSRKTIPNIPSKASTTLSGDGHGTSEAATTTKINIDLDKRAPRTTNPVLALPKKLEEDSFSSVSVSTGLSSLTTDMKSMSVKKRKNEAAQIPLPPPPFRQEPSPSLSAPTGPRKWSYFDNYNRLPPTTAANPGVQPRPSTGYWKCNQIGPSKQMYDS